MYSLKPAPDSINPANPEHLRALADEIDERYGPIPGLRADQIAHVLRTVAEVMGERRG
jgi:hypothetical protein